jgi:NhaC family Na+:H+ antiporter
MEQPATVDAPGEPPGARPPTMLQAIVPVAALIILLTLSYILFRDEASFGPNQIALLFCGLIAAGIAWRNGLPWSVIRQAAVDGVANGLVAIGILLAVGALIGTWALSGTILSMVYYGLGILSPNFFYASAAIICAVVSLSIGSSWTVAGTIGIGLMGIAQGMGLSPEITAGAVISGAYFGDKASPLSDTANLATAAAGSDLFTHIKESLWTSVPALVIAVAVFAILGEAGDFDASAIQATIASKYTISLWALLPLVVVLGLAVARVAPMVTIFIGALAGGGVAVVLNPDMVLAFAAAEDMGRPLALLKGVWAALATGYDADTGNEALDQLLSRGGMASMMVTVWLIMTALMFGAVVERAGMLERLIAPILAGAKSVGALVTSLVVTAVGANVITADQYIAIVLPGRMFKAEFARRGLAPVFLSRCIGDSATVTSPLIPWNSCGSYMAATLGIATTAFLPFCFFNLLNPLVTILFSIAGIRVLREAPSGATTDLAAPGTADGRG